jgi:fatty-acyl-CoA synthase
VAGLFAARARTHPSRVAIEEHGRDPITYAELARRTRQLAGGLAARGVGRGDRIAVLSENRAEYLELFIAAARLGAIVACQNARLTAAELGHCLALVSPRCTFVSSRHAEKVARLPEAGDVIELGVAYEALLTAAPPVELAPDLDPEDALLVLYTSGTTGMPKGAVISHRAEIVRNLVTRAEFGVAVDDAFAAWSPLSHMGAADNSLGALMSGGTVILVDGFDKARLAEVVATRELGWLILMPGMIAEFAKELRGRGVRAKGVKICGAMADLVPPADIAEITTLLEAPFANTFGATETGCPPCSSNRIPVGVLPGSLSKEASVFCEVHLVDTEDRDVADGEPGELAMRGPTLFSGYWNAEGANTSDFRGGWFHMGDVFVRKSDGTLDFVDRVKYLIKTGGENVYPAEIERVLLHDPRVADAAVVRRRDARWGEVPIAFVALKGASGVAPVSAPELFARCRAELAGYKQPKGIVFVELESFPRSASGKVQRHELEKRLATSRIEEPER